ncbi:hypothetical protein VTK73DRAFT_732 [Phialemonium thermophilum]|uniref:Uncharacterized protein n=1 Tax=Phialemonium thermophilum TaxID=223376 RepID=A0ABR3XDN2_9PEZI
MRRGRKSRSWGEQAKAQNLFVNNRTESTGRGQKDSELEVWMCRGAELRRRQRQVENERRRQETQSRRLRLSSSKTRRNSANQNGDGSKEFKGCGGVVLFERRIRKARDVTGGSNIHRIIASCSWSELGKIRLNSRRHSRADHAIRGSLVHGKASWTNRRVFECIT